MFFWGFLGFISDDDGLDGKEQGLDLDQDVDLDEDLIPDVVKSNEAISQTTQEKSIDELTLASPTASSFISSSQASSQSATASLRRTPVNARGKRSYQSARAKESGIKKRLMSSSASIKKTLSLNYVEVAIEKTALPTHILHLFDLYGISTLEDLESIDAAMLDDIERCVSENSLTAADFTTAASQIKFLGLEIASNVYKFKPFIRIKILTKLPGVVEELIKEKKELDTFRSVLQENSTVNKNQVISLDQDSGQGSGGCSFWDTPRLNAWLNENMKNS